MKNAIRPKHAIDFGSQLDIWRKLNALRNAKVVGESGEEVGEFLFADANTMLILKAPTAWHFDDKIEVEKGKSYPAQTVIHIQPEHELVTTGMRDAASPSSDPVKSCAGFWVSTQSVPSKTTSGGNEVWNVPQWPLPEPTNYDDKKNFWLYLGDVDCG